jgi:hypothetical protein
LQPRIDHGMGCEFCIFTRSVNPVRPRFNTAWINGDGPEVWLDPRTNGVAHASVFHRTIPTHTEIFYYSGFLRALGEGQKSEIARSHARGGGGLGQINLCDHIKIGHEKKLISKSRSAIRQ